MSDSVRPHRKQPTRLPRPWDSPGKNTGVGCHFLLQCMKVKSESEVAQSYPTPSDPMDCNLPGSSVHRIFQARVLEWGAIAFSSSKPRSSQIDLWDQSQAPSHSPPLTPSSTLELSLSPLQSAATHFYDCTRVLGGLGVREASHAAALPFITSLYRKDGPSTYCPGSCNFPLPAVLAAAASATRLSGSWGTTKLRKRRPKKIRDFSLFSKL